MYNGNHQTLIYIYRTSFRIFSPFPVIWNNRLCTYEGATFTSYSGNRCNLCAKLSESVKPEIVKKCAT